MPGSIDFNWQEGDEPFQGHPDLPSPPLPLREVMPSAPTVRRDQPPAARGIMRLSNAGLLIVGIVLGLFVGFIILMVQGQIQARADLVPLVELQQRALAQNDQDLYGSLVDPTDQMWRDLMVETFPSDRTLYDLDAEPKVRRVSLQGGYAEVEVLYSFAGEEYSHLDTMRLVNGQWRFSQPQANGWGALQTVEGEHVTLHFRQRDAFLEDRLPELDEVTATFCARYNPPPPCHLDLSITPDPDLLPFEAGEGAAPPPPVTVYRHMGEGDTPYLTLNGTGKETQDPAFRAMLLNLIRQTDDINDIYLAQRSTETAQDISMMRLFQRQIPLSVVSPRLVGIQGNQPHPLWLLALYDAMGDVIMRRAVGPITAETTSAYTLWAAGQGDVAIWAERLSGMRRPDRTPFSTDPAEIGAALTRGDAAARSAARSFALFLHAQYGEQALLDILGNARNYHDGIGLFAPLASTPRQLLDKYQAWQQARVRE